MRIDSSTSYLSKLQNYLKTSTTSETTETSAISDELINQLISSFSESEETATATSGETDESLSLESILSQMTSDPRAQRVRSQMDVAMERVMADMVETDLEGMSSEEQRALLESVTTQLASAKGQTVNSERLESLTDEEVTSVLTDMKEKALQGPKGPGGPGGAGRPSGPPPSGAVKPSEETDSTSETEDDGVVDTLEELLEALDLKAEEEEEEAIKNKKLKEVADKIAKYVLTALESESSIV